MIPPERASERVVRLRAVREGIARGHHEPALAPAPAPGRRGADAGERRRRLAVSRRARSFFPEPSNASAAETDESASRSRRASPYISSERGPAEDASRRAFPSRFKRPFRSAMDANAARTIAGNRPSRTARSDSRSASASRDAAIRDDEPAKDAERLREARAGRRDVPLPATRRTSDRPKRRHRARICPPYRRSASRTRQSRPPPPPPRAPPRAAPRRRRTAASRALCPLRLVALRSARSAAIRAATEARDSEVPGSRPAARGSPRLCTTTSRPPRRAQRVLRGDRVPRRAVQRVEGGALQRARASLRPRAHDARAHEPLHADRLHERAERAALQQRLHRGRRARVASTRRFVIAATPRARIAFLRNLEVLAEHVHDARRDALQHAHARGRLRARGGVRARGRSAGRDDGAHVRGERVLAPRRELQRERQLVQDAVRSQDGAVVRGARRDAQRVEQVQTSRVRERRVVLSVVLSVARHGGARSADVERAFQRATPPRRRLGQRSQHAPRGARWRTRSETRPGRSGAARPRRPAAPCRRRSGARGSTRRTPRRTRPGTTKRVVVRLRVFGRALQHRPQERDVRFVRVARVEAYLRERREVGEHARGARGVGARARGRARRVRQRAAGARPRHRAFAGRPAHRGGFACLLHRRAHLREALLQEIHPGRDPEGGTSRETCEPRREPPRGRAGRRQLCPHAHLAVVVNFFQCRALSEEA